MKWIIIAGTLSILGLLMFGVVSRLLIRKSDPYSLRTEAIDHAKQINLAFIDFDNDYGSFPDDSTIADVNDATGSSLPPSASSSNEIFRQLIAAGNKTEKIFWAWSPATPRKPDENISAGHALEKGECSFAYVNSAGPTAPLLMTPVIPSTHCFQRFKEYDNQAVILFIDGSVKLLPVDNHGQVELNGMNLFDPSQPFWKGKAPDIKWPE
ncbi:hypothetical protein [Luteolibacter soli]|uniref:DUF1559 domain-containing protein n=1 Tax=Luteolibacter soli TaxID=3135280 RepID=A0ABU9AY17_9BACT